ncbi:MAG TPA: PilN domain-containing protein [Myxococcaceae bacterium]|nr:PilN domain-containing protein [Myxococcaceae bacterium]
MMIRINLLPTRQVKKREAGKQIIALFAAVLIAALAGNYFWYDAREQERARNQDRINQTRARIADLEKVIGEVNNINKRKKEVEDKLKILDDLRKGRSGPVRMMDALATATPKKVWLKNFDESQGLVSLKGAALSHDDVAEMMRGLSSMVWTPKGMGRLVEQQKRDAKTSRVELLSQEGGIEDFPVGEVASFFQNIELKKATSAEQAGTSGQPATRVVDFEIQLNSNYAI